MIGCFPDPYPDELLYSVCARYQQRTQFSCLNINDELFDFKYERVVLDWPRNLGNLAKKLPGSSYYDLISLALKNSLLPLYFPFLNEFSYECLSDEILNFTMDNGHYRKKEWIRISRRLRFCPKCVCEDRKSFGETYWHRLHQIPYIVVCPEHLLLIVESDIRTECNSWGCFYFINEYYAAEDYIAQDLDEQIYKKTCFDDSYDQVLLEFAKSAQWLLNANTLEWTFRKNLWPQYISLIACRLQVEPSEIDRPCKFLTRNSFYRGHQKNKSNFVEFRDQFLSYHSRSFLRDLGYSLQEDIYSEEAIYWLYDILHVENWARQNPFRHFLFIQFLGSSVESLLSQA